MDDFVDFDAAERIGRLVADAIQHERARVRREEVEPLREALKAAADSLDHAGFHVPYEAARVALRAADERGK